MRYVHGGYQGVWRDHWWITCGQKLEELRVSGGGGGRGGGLTLRGQRMLQVVKQELRPVKYLTRHSEIASLASQGRMYRCRCQSPRLYNGQIMIDVTRGLHHEAQAGRCTRV